MIENLNDDNFLIYAVKCYNSPHYIISEFDSDIKRTKYLKRLFRRYKSTKVLKERLILNHLTILYNVFGADHTCKILYLKMKNQFKYIKPFLILLNIYQDKIYNVDGESVVFLDHIDMDENIIKALRKVNDEDYGRRRGCRTSKQHG